MVGLWPEVTNLIRSILSHNPILSHNLMLQYLWYCSLAGIRSMGLGLSAQCLRHSLPKENWQHVFLSSENYIQLLCSFSDGLFLYQVGNHVEWFLSGVPWTSTAVHQGWYGIQEGKTSRCMCHLQMSSPLGSIRGWKNNYFRLHNSEHQYSSEGWHPILYP